jgi:hypothetical protein
MEQVTIESLVPADHLLRKIDAAINLEFIRERVRHLYCADNGRPALDPVVLFKLLFIGYLFVEYLAQREPAVEEDRAAEGKRELKPKTSAPATKEIKVSRSDRKAGYMVREGKPKGFFYLDHRTVDAKHAIITDTHATPATVHDSVP